MDTQLKGKPVVFPPESSASSGAGLGDVAVTGAPAVGKIIAADSPTQASWKTKGEAGLVETTNPQFSGTMTLLGLGSRFRADFSSAIADCASFQSNVENGPTILQVIPNGTSLVSGVAVFNSSTPDNSAFGHFQCSDTGLRVISSFTGTSAYLPLYFRVGGADRVTVLPGGETGIGVAPIAGNGVFQVSSINGGQIGGKLRLNRNGNFDIWQRGSGPFSGTGYCADGWFCSYANGTFAVNPSSFAPGDFYGSSRPKNVLLWNQTVAGAGNQLTHRIPNVRKFDAKTVTVSFYAIVASGSANCSIQFGQNFGSGGSSQVLSAAQNFTLTPARTKFSFTFILPSIAGATIGTKDCGQVAFNWPNAAFAAYISEFQVEYGAFATQFEVWDSAEELAICRRWLRAQAVRVNTSANPTCMTIDMAAVPTISSGGTGFTSTGTTADTLICYQTTAAVQTLVMSCEP